MVMKQRSGGRMVVTGAAGFIGSHLVDSLLNGGHEVVGVDSFDPWYDVPVRHHNLRAALESPAFSLAEEDLLDDRGGPPAWLDGADVVFHLAGRPGVQDSWGRGFAACSRANIEATQRVLEWALAAGTRRVVLASSSSVYGATSGTGRRTVAPVSPYGASKAAAEQLAGVYRRQGLEVTVLRYFTVYGPRQRPDMAMHRLFSSVGGGPPFRRRGRGDRQREFTYVGDVVEATILAGTAADPSIAGATFDVGGGAVASLDQVIAAIATITGEQCHAIDDPPAAGDPRTTRADIRPIGRALGWRPVVTLEEGLARQWRWHQAMAQIAGPSPADPPRSRASSMGSARHAT